MNGPKDDPEYYVSVERFSDLEIAFPGNDLSKKLRFTIKSVEHGLKEEDIIEDLEVKVSYYEQEENPDYPKKDPLNSKIVVKKERKIRLQTYDFDKPKDNKGDYIEVYRLMEDGNPESRPAVKIFKPEYSSGLSVLVIDYDKEIEKSGFGIPDEVKEVLGISKGSDLYLRSQETIESLFNERKKEKPPEATPESPPMRAEIVEVGEIKSEEYEINVEGWTVPYNLSGGKNYDLWVKFKKEGPKEDEPKEIEYIAKRFHASGDRKADSQGRVVEFYRPEKQFLEGILMIEKNDKKHVIKVRKADGPIMEYVDSSILEEKPFKIEYDLGEFRETIEDQNRTPEKNSIYETKRRQRTPKELSLVNNARDY